MYDPLSKPVNVKLPEASAMVVAVLDPVRTTVALGPPAPLIIPEMLYACDVEVKLAVALALLIDTV
jgi:hypothetical protein